MPACSTNVARRRPGEQVLAPADRPYGADYLIVGTRETTERAVHAMHPAEVEKLREAMLQNISDLHTVQLMELYRKMKEDC